ncbi:MAG: radical SAM protein [Deltaproteobacteria bacterium]|nr:radical SAM protein [bacterium]MCB9477977.1 radical SAM protein [Deltaproteobacteria bacterium]MCB9489221.1 radical SAM protein [Deltaproteobacteria bacterium]
MDLRVPYKIDVREAIIAVTLRCNAKCTMCDIWEGDGTAEVEPSYYYHLPPTLTNINVTGGEATLREDLPEIMAVMAQRCPDARITLSTHGFHTKRLAEFLPRMKAGVKKLAIRVSIDGIGETHDRVRGIPGAYKKAMETLDMLRREGVEDIGVGFTLMKGNEDEMIPVFDMAVANGWQFTSTVVHSSPIFFGDQRDNRPDPDKAREAFRELERRQLRSVRPKDWFRAYFTDGVVDKLSGRPRRIQCTAVARFFYMDPTGKVYTCHILEDELGMLEEGYDTLVAKNAHLVEKVAHCPENCWMTCTVAPLMRQNLGKVSGWVGRHKLSA